VLQHYVTKKLMGSCWLLSDKPIYTKETSRVMLYNPNTGDMEPVKHGTRKTRDTENTVPVKSTTTNTDITPILNTTKIELPEISKNSRLKIFSNSELSDVEKSRLYLVENFGDTVDVKYYYTKIDNWCKRSGKKKTDEGWKALLYDIVNEDQRAGKMAQVKEVTETQKNFARL